MLHDIGKRREARDALKRLALRRPTAWRHFVLAEWLFAEKDYYGAYRHFQTARDSDPARERATCAVNQIIRAAARNESAVLLDFDEMILEMAPHGIPGWDTFDDNQHVNNQTLDIEARALAFELEKLWPGASILPGANSVPNKPLNYLRFADLRITAANDNWGESLVGFFQHAFAGGTKPVDPALVSYRFSSGEDAVGWHRALAPLSAGEGAWRAGDAARALELNAFAAKAAPAWAEPPFRRGVYLLALGRRSDARKNLEKAAALDPARTDARSLLDEIKDR